MIRVLLSCIMFFAACIPAFAQGDVVQLSDSNYMSEQQNGPSSFIFDRPFWLRVVAVKFALPWVQAAWLANRRQGRERDAG